MSVKLREKSLKNEGVSFYLDIINNGKRWTEFLSIYAHGKRRSTDFIEKKKLAEKARALREYEISVQKLALPNEIKGNECFYDFIEKHKKFIRGKNSDYLTKKLKLYTRYDVLPMNKIDLSFAVGFYQFLSAQGLGNTTRYNLIGIMSSYVNKAVEAELMTINPFHKIPKSMRIKLKKSIPKFLTLQEIQMLADNSVKVPEQIKLGFLFSCFTGLRWSDFSRLKWSEISTQVIEGKEHVFLHRVLRKGQNDVRLPLSAQALEILEQRNKTREAYQPYVFPELVDVEGSEKAYVRASFQVTQWGKRNGIHLHIHKARHSFATLTLQMGADLYTVSKLLGHSNIKNTVIYAQVLDQTKIAAVANLPTIVVNMNTSNNEIINKNNSIQKRA